MELHLDAEEQQFLIDVLEQRYHELLWELARADKPAFKAALREQVRMMEKVLQKAEVIELTVK
jgi:hypothetical protein